MEMAMARKPAKLFDVRRLRRIQSKLSKSQPLYDSDREDILRLLANMEGMESLLVQQGDMLETLRKQLDDVGTAVAALAKDLEPTAHDIAGK